MIRVLVQEGEVRGEPRAEAAAAGRGRVGQVDVHQADEDHPRHGLLPRGEGPVRQAHLPEHRLRRPDASQCHEGA